MLEATVFWVRFQWRSLWTLVTVRDLRCCLLLICITASWRYVIIIILGYFLRLVCNHNNSLKRYAVCKLVIRIFLIKFLSFDSLLLFSTSFYFTDGLLWRRQMFFISQPSWWSFGMFPLFYMKPKIIYIQKCFVYHPGGYSLISFVFCWSLLVCYLVSKSLCLNDCKSVLPPKKLGWGRDLLMICSHSVAFLHLLCLRLWGRFLQHNENI